MIAEHEAIVNDLRTRYLIGGSPSAPTVVFLHDGAWGASADVTWGHVLPLAAQKYRVIAPDMPGFGGTAKAIRTDEPPFGFRMRHVFALLDALGENQPVHVVGNSFGGSVGLRALTNPELAARIDSVTSISGTGGPWRTPEAAQLGPFDGTEADIRRIVELLCDPFDDVDQQVTDRYGWARQPGHYAAVMAIHTQVPEPLQVQRPADPFPANLADVEVPIMLFECRGDPLVEKGWTAHITAVHSATTVVDTPYKHAPNITHPAETWQHIDEFLSKVSGARS